MVRIQKKLSALILAFATAAGVLSSGCVAPESLSDDEVVSAAASALILSPSFSPAPSPSHAYQYFGRSVAVSGNRMVVGASGDNTAKTSGGAVRVYRLVNGSWQLDNTITANTGTGGTIEAQAYAHFGAAVALHNDLLVVGAPEYDGSYGGVAKSDCGRIYVYQLGSGTVTLLGRLSRQVFRDQSDNFGAAVAVDGTTIVAGAPYAREAPGSAVTHNGEVQVFQKVTGGFSYQGALISTDSTTFELGRSVDVSGSTVVAGAPSSHVVAGGVLHPVAGKAYVFQKGATTYSQTAVLDPTSADLAPESEGQFGSSIAIDDGTIVVGEVLRGGSWEGAVHLFNATGFAHQQTLTAPGGPGEAQLFGAAVAKSGGTIVVGAPYTDGSGAYLYQLQPDGTYGMEAQMNIDAWSVSVSGGYVAAGAHWESDSSGTTARGNARLYTTPGW